MRVAYRGEDFIVTTRLLGPHWTVSVLAALLTALELGVDRQDCLSAIASFEPRFNRMSVHQIPSGVWYVLDAEKASFFGIDACLGFLDGAQAARRTVVFGTISDYPGDSSRRYRRAARMALQRAERVIFTGPNARHVRRLLDREEFKGKLLMVEDHEELSRKLSQDTIRGEVVYVKASDADDLERVLILQLDRDACRKGINCREFLRRKYRPLLARPAAFQ